MTTSTVESEIPDVIGVSFTENTMNVQLSDGRSVSVPLEWFPRLAHGTAEERDNWRMIGRGRGIHWENLDEDISVEGLLAGKPSGESQNSFERWLTKRSGPANSSS